MIQQTTEKEMSPWIPGYTPRDQHETRLHQTRYFHLLPWQTFPASTLYTCFGAVAWGSAALLHQFVRPQHLLAKLGLFAPAASDAESCIGSLLHTAAMAIWTPVLCAIPCAVLFVGFMYVHSRSCCRETNRGDGDCTQYVLFKDHRMHSRYKGRRIDMETMYEMYFDGQLDFVKTESDEFGLPIQEGGVCLLKDILSQRHKFVGYTFGLTTHVRFLLLKWIPDVLSHSRKQDLAQIRDHYDMSTAYRSKIGPFTGDKAEDDFFGMFLGQRMVYTSGIASPAPPQQQQQQSLQDNSDNISSALNSKENIEVLQDNKLRLLCKKLRLAKGETHLDIGCGWGTLVNHSASKHGTIATGVTLSRNQVMYANAVSQKMGIKDHRTTFWCMDYRDIPTNVGVQYDKISCIEMAEHVGVKNFQDFLVQVRSLLKDDGIFLLQIAGLRRAFQYEDLVWGLFMAKYIFPGADASMPLNWVVGQLELAGFEVAQVDNIGIHYSLTLKRWYDNWVFNKDKVVEKHGERWYRIFHFFLAWSTYIAGTGAATCYQITCHKNINAFDRRKLGVPHVGSI